MVATCPTTWSANYTQAVSQYTHKRCAYLLECPHWTLSVNQTTGQSQVPTFTGTDLHCDLHCNRNAISVYTMALEEAHSLP